MNREPENSRLPVRHQSPWRSPGVLVPAFMPPRRFDRKRVVDLPITADRRKILEENRGAMDRLAELLIEKQEVSGDPVYEPLGGNAEY